MDAKINIPQEVREEIENFAAEVERRSRENINENGFNPFSMDPEELPESDEELGLYMQLNYKPAIEIAQEEAIDTLFADNKYIDLLNIDGGKEMNTYITNYYCR